MYGFYVLKGNGWYGFHYQFPPKLSLCENDRRLGIRMKLSINQNYDRRLLAANDRR